MASKRAGEEAPLLALEMIVLYYLAWLKSIKNNRSGRPLDENWSQTVLAMGEFSFL